MARNDAVTAVTGEIFREGWSRVRGSMQGLGEKRAQMTRAAKGHRAAVFKPIRSGGCHTKGQLSNQLEYLTTKSSFVVDSRGVLDGKKQLTSDEIKGVANRFANRWSEGFRPKMGHTTHMLMSFPIGTKGADVRDVASGVCERFFANEERNFDYIIAVHEDRAHPHAHVVLNRRSQEGEYFFLGRDHHFNYDDFRAAMVEEAEKVGVRLEATRRLDRGVASYAPRTKEIYAAKEGDRTPNARERVGRDLDRALAEIATTSTFYRSLAAEASAENREDISNALFRASEMLARGGQLEQNGEIYMATQESFDDLRGRFAERAERVERFVRDAPDGMKAKYEKQLDAIYRNVAHMQPVGVRSATLNDAASDTGVYSEANINKDAVGTLKEPQTRAQIETALRGTGISSSAVIARVEQGAGNAWLEQRWMADDLSKIAKSDGLNLERKEDLAIAAEKLDQVHVQVGQTLERAEVLREDGVIETVVVADDTYVRDVELPEQREFLDQHPELLGSPSDVYRVDGDGVPDQILNPQRADQIDREVQAIVDRSDGRMDMEDAIEADFKARYPDMPGHLAAGLASTYANSFELNNSDALREAELQVAQNQDTREAASDAIRLDVGIARAEAEGIARENAGTLAEVQRGVAAQFDGTADEFTRFEPIVVERGLIDNDNRHDGNPVALSIVLQQLVAERTSVALDAQADRRADVLIRDTVNQYGQQMTDGVAREYASRLSELETARESGSDGDRTVTQIEVDGIKQEPDALAKVIREYSTSQITNTETPRTLEQAREDAISQGVAEEVASLRAQGYSRAHISERSFDIEDAVIARGEAHERLVDTAPEIARVIEHERTDRINPPFADGGRRDAFRSEMERDLSEVQIEALIAGDSEALSDVIDDRLDRLYAAKAYLQSDEATANSDATREVVSEIAEEEFDAQRLKHVHANAEKGQTHG